MKTVAAHHFETIVGDRIGLVPYEPKHVLMYHLWLEDAHIQEMTGTDPVSLEEEYESQIEWSCSTNKFMKVIQANDSGKLVGDINIFFTDKDGEDAAEINIMIADLGDRNRGYASEALMLIMAYTVQKFNVNHFYVKVLAKNEPALKFFAKHGFKQEGSVDAFGEIRMGLATDSLPRTELTIVKSAAH